jgi:CDP-diacylglycerol--glycerol-3-phosphate 3-phosphatidyltransferase
VLNLPNTLTLSRIISAPLVVWLLWAPEPTAERNLAAAVIFALAATTDLLDGYLARRRDAITAVGKLLDPLADKILVGTGLIMLALAGRVPAWMVWVILGREVLVSAIRVIALREGLVISAHFLGKNKALFQMTAIFFLILDSNIPIWGNLSLGLLLMWVALALTVVSGFEYLWRFGYLLLGRGRGNAKS